MILLIILLSILQAKLEGSEKVFHVQLPQNLPMYRHLLLMYYYLRANFPLYSGCHPSHLFEDFALVLVSLSHVINFPPHSSLDYILKVKHTIVSAILKTNTQKLSPDLSSLSRSLCFSLKQNPQQVFLKSVSPLPLVIAVSLETTSTNPLSLSLH